MKGNNTRRRLCAVLVILLLCVSMLSTVAMARGPIDLTQKTSLALDYVCGGAVFQIYRVADVSRYAEYTLTKEFSGYAVLLPQQSQDGWRELAATLAAYAVRDNLLPLKTAATDTAGKLQFADLTPGLYLVTGARTSSGGYYYTPSPFLVVLPGLDAADQWVPGITVQVKYSRDIIPTGGGETTTSQRVLKIWKDDGYAARPSAIEVQLLRDGQVYDTVTLSEKNNWKYEWNNLSSRYFWQMVEKTVPEGYWVSSSPDQSGVVITNTLEKIPEKPAPGKLPVTGLLWWPVGLMAAGGLLLLLVGLRVRKDGHEA